MATTKKVTDLTAITSATGDDLLYLVNDPSGTPGSRKITVNNFANSIKTQVSAVIPNTSVVANSVTFQSSGTANVAFLTYTFSTGATGCADVFVHARDVTTNEISSGHLFVAVQNSSSIGITQSIAQAGVNTIDFNVTPTVTSNTVTMYFRRGAASTANISLRFAATIF